MLVLIQRIKRNIKSITIHALTWLVLLMINYVFLKNYVINFDLTFHILIWAIYVSLFYICYSFLIPIFLFRKKVLAFIAGSLILISGSYLINQTIAINQFITVFKQMSDAPGPNPFGPNQSKPVPPGLMRPPFPEFDREVLRRPDLEIMLQNMRPMGRGPGFDRKLFSLSGLLLVYFATISIKVLLKLRDDEKKKEEIMKERISTELLYLKQQVNPHFLFNTLNNIYSLSIKNPEITPSAILKVSSILRYTLYKSDNSLALLRDEIEIINAYMDFQKMRFKNNLPVTYDVSGPIDDYKIEPFILLPLIENAFKYGMDNINDSFINIQITIKSEKLKFLISNKKSYTNGINLEHSGIGLKNIKRRLDLVYPDCHELLIVDNDDIFSVCLELPLKP
jgi:two-component system, LytTR family, sensor kinase